MSENEMILSLVNNYLSAAINELRKLEVPEEFIERNTQKILEIKGTITSAMDWI